VDGAADPDGGLGILDVVCPGMGPGMGAGAGTPWAPTRRRIAAALDELMYNIS